MNGTWYFISTMKSILNLQKTIYLKEQNALFSFHYIPNQVVLVNMNPHLFYEWFDVVESVNGGKFRCR